MFKLAGKFKNSLKNRIWKLCRFFQWILFNNNVKQLYTTFDIQICLSFSDSPLARKGQQIIAAAKLNKFAKLLTLVTLFAFITLSPKNGIAAPFSEATKSIKNSEASSSKTQTPSQTKLKMQSSKSNTHYAANTGSDTSSDANSTSNSNNINPNLNVNQKLNPNTKTHLNENLNLQNTMDKPFPTQIENWNDFSQAIHTQKQKDYLNGWSYIISGGLALVGGILGTQVTNDPLERGVYTLFETMGIASIGYGAYIWKIGGEERFLYNTLQRTHLTPDQKSEFLVSYHYQIKDRDQKDRALRSITHGLISALNFYSANQQSQPGLKTTLNFIGGVNLLAAISFSFDFN